MTRREYERYQASVRAFFDREGITNLSTGPLECPDCGCVLECGQCPKCGQDAGQIVQEPYFSWVPCDCCRRQTGGDREDAHGYHPSTGTIHRYSVCSDCVYYAEYGCLDDQTMQEVERD